MDCKKVVSFRFIPLHANYVFNIKLYIQCGALILKIFKCMQTINYLTLRHVILKCNMNMKVFQHVHSTLFVQVSLMNDWCQYYYYVQKSLKY